MQRERRQLTRPAIPPAVLLGADYVIGTSRLCTSGGGHVVHARVQKSGAVRPRLARDVLHDRHGALANEPDGHRVGPNAVARDAAAAWGALNRASRP